MSNYSNHVQQRGVLFTFLVFLLIGVLIGLVLFNNNFLSRVAESTVEVSVLGTINAKYDDITDDIITLDHFVGVPSIQQRILPFSYTINENALTVAQTLPISSGKLSQYFDLINAYSVFVADQNVSTTFDGVIVDIHVPQPPAWGGDATGAGFNVLPQCLQYRLKDETNTSFESLSTVGCSTFFDLETHVSRIDVTISLPNTVDDYNVLSCSYGGTSSCPTEDYNSALGPYFSITFLDANCANCALSSSEKSISGYLSSSVWDTFTYSCSGSSCVSEPLTIELGNGARFSHDGSSAVVTTQVTFTEDISTFYYQDANYSVQKPGFTTYKSNVVVFPQ